MTSDARVHEASTRTYEKEKGSARTVYIFHNPPKNGAAAAPLPLTTSLVLVVVVVVVVFIVRINIRLFTLLGRLQFHFTSFTVHR